MRAIFVILLVTLSSCSRVPVRKDVAAAITETLAKGDSTLVDLDKLAPFAWDEVCLLGPFMRPVDISAKIGFEWKGKRSGSRGSFVFVDTRRPRSDSVATGHVPILPDQWLVEASGCLPRSEAKFIARSAASGIPTLVPVSGDRQHSPNLRPF
jgi:hypothetical protein